MINLRLISKLPSWLFVPAALATVLAACGTAPESSQEAVIGPSLSGTDGPFLSQPVVQSDLHHDVSPPLWLIPPARRPTGFREHVTGRLPRPPGPKQLDPVVQDSAPSAALAPTTLLNFDGVGNGFSGPSGTFTVNSAPPDPNGDVGPNHYVQSVNTDFAVFNKSGTAIYGPVPTNTLWAGFSGGCETNNDGDAIVIYDRMADRWVISQFSVSITPYLQCVAVSQTPDPTGAYFRYSFSYGSTSFPDYPKMSVWPDAYYETFNMFASSSGNPFLGGQVCAYDRAKMLANQPATQQCFNVGINFGGLLVGSLDGARVPPAGSPAYVFALDANNTSLDFWKFHVDFISPANSTLTGPTALTTAPFTLPCNGAIDRCVPQAGTIQKLDTLGDRLMFRLAYRNFGDHESLVVNHSVMAGSATGVRWYEIRTPATVPTIFQQGTYAPDSNSRWMGSIAMDQAGNIGLGYSVSGSTIHPQIHFTGRAAGDPLGIMTQGEGTLVDGAGSQASVPPNMPLSRWGDYTRMAVDPSDDCTFWYTNQYIPADGTFNWKTRIGTFKLPGCAVPNDFSISANPTSLSVAPGASGTSTINTAVTSGSAQTVNLTASVLPPGPVATLNPTAVTAGGSSTLTVTVGASVAPGSYTVTVTGTEGSMTHSTQVAVTVPPSDFSISASPSSLTIAQHHIGTSTISTAVTSGRAQTLTLTVADVPAGAIATLNPSSITAGGGSRLTVHAGTAAPGTYSLRVTGASASASHSTNVTLIVPRNDFSISALPTRVSVGRGGVALYRVRTAITSGAAERVVFSISGLPQGARATFNPSSVASGGRSTLSVTTQSTTPVGDHTLTITGTAASGSHSVRVVLNVR